MDMSGFWFIGMILLIEITNHFWLVWRRNQIQNLIQQSIAIGNIETWIQFTDKRYRMSMFDRHWNLRVEVFVTEKAIFVFRIVKFLRCVKIYQRFHVIFLSSQDVPEIANNFGLLFMNNSFHRVDSFQINGRQIDLVVSYLVSSFGKLRRIRQYQYVFSNVRDNDAYRNFLRLQRYHHQIIQQQRMQSSISER